MNNRNERKQTITNLKGEVQFREKLSRQHVTGEVLLPDYHGKEDHDRILRERIDTTKNAIRQLLGKGLKLSPFLELGAERGQRSLVLCNDYNSQGVAIDISYHQLRSMKHFAKLFHRQKLPHRICCDANNLPFRNNSFPFAFCYEFLHHFPSLNPIVREIHRVMSAGFFFFAEEPYKKLLKITLYKKRNKIYSISELRKNRYLRFLESYMSESYTDEAEHGIYENHSIALQEWIEALSVFQEKDIRIASGSRLSTKLPDRLSIHNIPNALLGGEISGLCRKNLEKTRPRESSIYDLLACPDCKLSLSNGDVDRPPLHRSSNFFECTLCHSKFQIREGIIILLPQKVLDQLYPEFRMN